MQLEYLPFMVTVPFLILQYLVSLIESRLGWMSVFYFFIVMVTQLSKFPHKWLFISIAFHVCFVFFNVHYFVCVTTDRGQHCLHRAVACWRTARHVERQASSAPPALRARPSAPVLLIRSVPGSRRFAVSQNRNIKTYCKTSLSSIQGGLSWSAWGVWRDLAWAILVYIF